MPYTCVVVEDSKFIQEIYFYELRNSDFEIIAFCENGIEGLQTIKRLNPDIVILDLVLPGLSGIDILKQIDSNQVQSKFIVISSVEEAAIKDQVRALGALVYIEKPFAKSELFDALNFCLEQEGRKKNG